MGKKKGKYSKKPYKQAKSKRADKASNKLKAAYEKHFPNNKKFQLMIGLYNEGVNIAKIAKELSSIPSVWKEKTGTPDLKLDLSKKTVGFERAVLNAFELLTKRLNPVFPDTNQGLSINGEITKMQSEFKKYEETIKEYLNLRLYEIWFEDLKGSLFGSIIDIEDSEKTTTLSAMMRLLPLHALKELLRKKIKPAKQSSHNLFNDAIFGIIQELFKRYSARKSYAITAELLHLSYPDIYTDKDPDRVRQIYLYCFQNKK